ncbi:hypothetical protein DFH09DRAFT_1411502 [Mycena vulgaris]|nr:hypothetical protein DFH09DRAFT_1411502 [Mycena vulgaris]
MTTPAPNPTRHATYYLETITFEVEDCLFKVPRRHFESNSEIFRTASTLPAGAEGEGLSDQNPVKLEGISSADFERLLAVLYPMEPSIPEMPKEHWISVLKLATMWRLIKARDVAISQLDAQVKNDVEGIMLGRKYHVSDWLRSGYLAVAIREAGMSPQDAEMIGWETAVKIYRVREAFFVRWFRDRGHMPPLRGMRAEYFGSDFGTVFAEEFAQADADSDQYIDEADRSRSATPDNKHS